MNITKEENDKVKTFLTFEEYMDSINLKIVDMARITEQSRQTLKNWYSNPKKRKVFDMLAFSLLGERSERD